MHVTLKRSTLTEQEQDETKRGYKNTRLQHRGDLCKGHVYGWPLPICVASKPPPVHCCNDTKVRRSLEQFVAANSCSIVMTGNTSFFLLNQKTDNCNRRVTAISLTLPNTGWPITYYSPPLNLNFWTSNSLIHAVRAILSSFRHRWGVSLPPRPNKGCFV